MARQRALTGEPEAEARKLLASGVSAREVARRFGVDHKTVTKLGKTAPASGSTGSTPAATATGDDFEAQQLALLGIIDARLGCDDVSARDLAGLVKAKNDTIKAIRAFRAMSRGVSEQDDDGTADLVMAKLQRLQEVGRMVAPVAEAPAAEPEKNGTEHS